MSRHGKNLAESGLTSDQRKARHMKRAFWTAIAIIIVLVVCLGFLLVALYQEGNNFITQQTLLNQETQKTPSETEDEKESSDKTVREIAVPNLVELLGKSSKKAEALLASRGATVTGTYEVKEQGSSLKEWVHIALANEPGDSRSGTPTVYLGLNEKGFVQTVGYSAPLSLLGYGSISFADAINNERVIEKTFAESGLTVPKTNITLPEDRTEYSTYATDGTTLIKEDCSFEGSVDQAGKTYHWSAILKHDYTLANSSGNLADTIRRIYIEVSVV